MGTRFIKMHGCGNDFVVFDGRVSPLDITAVRAAAVADRHTGVGCDQLIVIEPARNGADAFMRIRNPDGTEAGACGNATRCVAHLLSQDTARTHLTIRTVSGDLPCQMLPGGSVRVDMGRVRLEWPEIPLARPTDTLRLDLAVGPVADPAAASMGNPHATFFVADLRTIPIEQIGPILERDPWFPERANIGFVQVLASDRIRLRVWERGAGLTLACGSGACAALVNAHRRGLVGRRAEVLVDGGSLTIEWREDNHVLMTGPIAMAFAGEIDLEAYPA